MVLDFVMTKEHRRFAEFCDACRRDRYIGLCHGVPGVGKTLSARYYARWDSVENALYSYGRPSPAPLSTDPVASDPSYRTVFYTPAVANSPHVIERQVLELRLRVAHLADHAADGRQGTPTVETLLAEAVDCLPTLLIVDEADRLRMAGLEQVRDLYDRHGGGLVLIGMPGLEKRLARYPQLYSRVGFLHQFRALGPDEVRFLLEQKWQQLGLTFSPEEFTDAEALAAITRITSGNFRLLQRLLAQVDRILRINEFRTVTKEVVEAARENLVIGSL